MLFLSVKTILQPPLPCVDWKHPNDIGSAGMVGGGEEWLYQANCRTFRLLQRRPTPFSRCKGWQTQCNFRLSDDWHKAQHKLTNPDMVSQGAHSGFCFVEHSRDPKIKVWFVHLANEIKNLSYEDAISSRKTQQLMTALKVRASIDCPKLSRPYTSLQNQRWLLRHDGRVDSVGCGRFPSGGVELSSQALLAE